LRFSRSLAVAVLAALTALPVLGSAAPLRSGFAADVVHRIDISDLGRAPAAQPVRIAVSLNFQHEAELRQLVLLQSTPGSPYYRRYLTPAQFNAYFAPAPSDVAKAVAALRKGGFTVTHVAPNGTLIDASATTAVAESYFATEIHRVAQIGQGQRYANVRPAVMPHELAGIVSAVSGLNNLIVAKPSLAFSRFAGRRIATPARSVASLGVSPQACFLGIFCTSPTPSPKPTTKPTASPTPGVSPSPIATPTPVITATPTPSPSTAPGGGAPIPSSPLRGPDNGYGPIAVAAGYDLPVQHGYNGAGHATGVAISGDYSDADLNTYLATFGITRAGTTTRVEVDGGATYNSSFSTSNASVEATLDVETIVGNAPGTHLYMYLFPDLSSTHIEDGYSQAVADNAVDVVNSSFGGCETSDTSLDTTSNNIATNGAAIGITFAASSGDSGSKECGTSFLGLGGSTGVSSPASGPEFVAVGGTTLTVGATGTYTSEAAWSGSGGGTSTEWAEPSYQSGIAKSTSGRNVPDVGFAADPNSGTALYFGGAWNGPIGGTSWACPIFSAFITEANEIRGGRSGFVNTRLYNAFKTYGYGVYHDVTSGNNGSFSAATGYDEVTGIGSTQGYALSQKF
jgi:kumamolisin